MGVVIRFWGLPVNSSHGHLVTRSSRHRHVASHSQLVTSEHNKTTSTSRNYLHPVSLRRHPETVLNTHGIIAAICVTLMYTADSISLRQITLLLKAWSTRHDAVKHDGQLVTRFYDVTSWPCDKLTGSPSGYPLKCIVPLFPIGTRNLHSSRSTNQIN